MRSKAFIYLASAIWIVLTIYSCSQTKKTVDITVEKYTILCKEDFIPKDEDFAPYYILKDAVKVNKTKNEWLITLQNGEKPISEAIEFLKKHRFIVKVSAPDTSKSSSNSQKKSNINITN
ncbi:MAG TPA: hypothetical protein PKD51_03495 [Saprospiraceae bacterium]|nr:hypothetical protein [Saprospiraceae bacterium]